MKAVLYLSISVPSLLAPTSEHHETGTVVH